jgi:hypothetical protein
MSRIANPGMSSVFEESVDNYDDFPKSYLDLQMEDTEIGYFKIARSYWKMRRHKYLKEFSKMPEDIIKQALKHEDDEGYLLDTRKGYAWYRKEDLERVLIGHHPLNCSGMDYYLQERT